MQSMWKFDKYVLIHNQVFHNKLLLFNFIYLQSIIRFCAKYVIKIFQKKNRTFKKLFM